MPSGAPTRMAPAPSIARTDHGRRTTHDPHEAQSSPGAVSSLHSPRSRGNTLSRACGRLFNWSRTRWVISSTRRSTSDIEPTIASDVLCHPERHVLICLVGADLGLAVLAHVLLVDAGLDPLEQPGRD